MSLDCAFRETLGFDAFSVGRRLRCVTEPARGPVRGSVVLAPPFAEEMNKSRRMCARMARELAQDGWRVARLDLYGCGDSGGELRDATWARWVDDLTTEARRAAAHTPGPLWIWCVRAGALFAQDMLDAVPGANLLLWQPVTSGSLHLQQFLRLRAAAQMLRAGNGPPGDRSAAEDLVAGRSVEIGGYELPSAVAQGLRAASFRWPAGRRGRVAWLELAGGEPAQASPATLKAIDAVRAEGGEVALELLPGDPFWQSTEIVENEALLERTRALLRESAPDAPAHGVSGCAEPRAGPTRAEDDDIRETTLQFDCEGVMLPGILSAASDASTLGDLGVVVVVGGPQYRVGSHRQFVQLARSLARDGCTVLRFDYRGMGDAAGPVQSFEAAGPDVHAAIDALRAAPHVRRVVLWGLCDAASIILMQGASHPKVRGVVLANPWVRNAATIASATIKHYYRGRLLQKDLWRKVLSGDFDWRASCRSLMRNVAHVRGARGAAAPAPVDFRVRMAQGLAAFRGAVLLLLSGDDMTAREFVDFAGGDAAWRNVLSDARVQRVQLAEADHTFSQRAWKAEVEQCTRDWLRRLP